MSQVCSDIREIVFSIKSSQTFHVTTSIEHSKATTKAQRQNIIHAQSDTDHNFQTKLIAIGRIFPFLLKVVHNLGQTNQGKNLEVQVIYHFVKLFRDLLQHVCALSTSHIKTNEQLKSSQKNRKSTRAKPKVSSRAKISQTQDKSIKTLCRFFNILIAALDNNNPTDNQILEGFLFFLLHRIGTTLRVFVFGDDANNILPLKPVPHHPYSTRNYEERQNAEAQAPYLIFILSHTIHAATHRPSLTTTASHVSTNPPVINRTHPTSTSLQSTLLTALFGPACAAEFPDALPNPETQIQNDWVGMDAMSSGSEDEVADWFKSEVWRIVGWDVLAGCIAWE